MFFRQLFRIPSRYMGFYISIISKNIRFDASLGMTITSYQTALAAILSQQDLTFGVDGTVEYVFNDAYILPTRHIRHADIFGGYRPTCGHMAFTKRAGYFFRVHSRRFQFFLFLPA